MRLAMAIAATTTVLVNLEEELTAKTESASTTNQASPCSHMHGPLAVSLIPSRQRADAILECRLRLPA